MGTIWKSLKTTRNNTLNRFNSSIFSFDKYNMIYNDSILVYNKVCNYDFLIFYALSSSLKKSASSNIDKYIELLLIFRVIVLFFIFIT